LVLLRYVLNLAMLLWLTMGIAVAAGEFDAGVIAYQNKRFEEAGSLDAQYNLAGLYYRGERVPQDISDAIYWLAQVANQGHVEAQYNLGVVLSNGQHAKADPARALTWLRLAAEAEYAPALKLIVEIEQKLKQAAEKTAAQNAGTGDWRDAEELWLFHQDPRDFTLELYRNKDFEQVQAFIEQLGIAEISRYYIYGSELIVIGGLFNSHFEATEAIGGLTDDLKLQLPRPITFAAIHDQIRHN
jgi:hypothetical protein